MSSEIDVTTMVAEGRKVLAAMTPGEWRVEKDVDGEPADWTPVDGWKLQVQEAHDAK